MIDVISRQHKVRHHLELVEPLQHTAGVRLLACNDCDVH
jgi:hypothetical protein